MKILIEKANNGYIMIIKDPYADSGTEKLVFSETDAINSQLEAFTDLLYSLNELIGPTTSRYSEARLVIRTEPGDKYEPCEQGSLHSTGLGDEPAERQDNTDRGSDR